VASGAQRTLPEVALVISYRGVRFMDPMSGSLVCEHEIRNIDCACQDADDLNHFAYITKDHHTSSHYSHVFSVASMVRRILNIVIKSISLPCYKLLIFADEMKLFFLIKSISNCHLQNDLQRLVSWGESMELVLDIPKCFE